MAATFDREVIRLLENAGCRPLRGGKGRHTIWYSLISKRRPSDYELVSLSQSARPEILVELEIAPKVPLRVRDEFAGFLNQHGFANEVVCLRRTKKKPDHWPEKCQDRRARLLAQCTDDSS